MTGLSRSLRQLTVCCSLVFEVGPITVALDSNVSEFEQIRLIRRPKLYGTFLLQYFGGGGGGGGSLREEAIDACLWVFNIIAHKLGLHDGRGDGRVVRWCWVNFQCRGVLQF